MTVRVPQSDAEAASPFCVGFPETLLCKKPLSPSEMFLFFKIS